MVAMAILAAALCIPKPAATSASWNDGESAQRVFTAMTLPVPTGVTCKVNNTALGAFSSMTITWSTAGSAYTYQVGATTSSAGPYNVETPEDAPVVGNGNGTWTATISNGLLGGILGGLLGSTSYYAIRTSMGSWTGRWGPRVTLSFPILGTLVGGTCTVAS
jgi:tetrahydromethanopterin S-methyltransferase subunit D